VPSKDVATWLCLTVRAMTGSKFTGNNRSRAVVDSLWAKLASLCNFRPRDTMSLYQSLIDEIVCPAIDLSRQIRMCRSRMWVRFGASNEAGVDLQSSQSSHQPTAPAQHDFAVRFKPIPITNELLQLQPRLVKETRLGDNSIRPIVLVDVEKLPVTVVE
jgi:hypothetical protein